MFFYVYFIVIDFLIEMMFITAYFLFIFIEINLLRASLFVIQSFNHITIFIFFSIRICYNK